MTAFKRDGGQRFSYEAFSQTNSAQKEGESRWLENTALSLKFARRRKLKSRLLCSTSNSVDRIGGMTFGGASARTNSNRCI